MMRSASFIAALFVVLAVRVAVAQQPLLGQRLDAQTVAALRPIFDSARVDSLPATVLEDKALEGSAKHVPPMRIVAVVRQLAADLREARGVLRSAAPGAPLSDGEVSAAADACHRGVPATEIAVLRGRVPPATGLIVAFTVLGDLVQRGVPVDQARAALEQLLAANVPASQIAELPSRLDVGLRLGASPADALRNALPVPFRAPKPGTPPSGGSMRPGVPRHP